MAQAKICSVCGDPADSYCGFHKSFHCAKHSHGPIGIGRASTIPEVEARPFVPTVQEIPVVKAIKSIKPTLDLPPLSSVIRKNVKSKVWEGIILAVAAAILGAYGFIYAAVGLVFFAAFLFMPSETEIMERARRKAEILPVNILTGLANIQKEIILTEQGIEESETEEERRALKSKLRSLMERKNEIIGRAMGAGATPQQIKDIVESVEV